MSDSGRSLFVLQKLLKGKAPADETPAEKIEKFLKPERTVKKTPAKSPGRPKVADHLKARNFTLCLAHRYVDFIDRMTVKDPKVQGRGRKIRFIIDRFIDHERRQIAQLKIFREALVQVDQVLKEFSKQVKKGEKLTLTAKEKAEVSRVVNQVQTLLKILCYVPKDLQKILPRDEWALLAFSLDWVKKGN